MDYTHINLSDVRDQAPDFGIGEHQEARFATNDLQAQRTGIGILRIKPGRRSAFGHRHEQAEEVYVVVGGSGRAKIDDDVIELTRLDAIRIAPAAVRAFEGGPDGLDLLACGQRHENDGEVVDGWWPEGEV